MKAKAFYDSLKCEEPATLKLSFDCQKNLVLPRVQDQTAYYLRQLYLYNFTICEGHSRSPQTKDKIFIYTWTESDRLKGSSEIASMVYNRLENTNLDSINCIKLYADGCPGQNKNITIVGMLAKWLASTASTAKSVHITFPVVGHSFLPSDRIFGRTEKVIRKMETIANPESYKTIFRNYGTVLELGRDFQVYDWKKAVESAIKPPGQWHFQFAAAKRIILKKKRSGDDVVVSGEVNYKSDIGVFKSILKRGKSLKNIKPQLLANQVPVKEAKLKDVQTLLLKHYGEGWKDLEELHYYKSVLSTQLMDGEEDDAREEEEEGHEIIESEDLRI